MSEQSALGTAELFWLPGVSPSAPNERVHSAYRLLYLMSNKIAMDQGVHHTPRPTDHPPHAAPHGAALFGSFVIHPDPNAYVTPDGAWQRTRGVVHAGISLLEPDTASAFWCLFCALCVFGITASVVSGQGCIRREGISEAAPEAVRQAVGGGYCRLQMPLKLALAVWGDSGWA